MAFMPVDNAAGSNRSFVVTVRLEQVDSFNLHHAVQVWVGWVSKRKEAGQPWVDVVFSRGIACSSGADGEVSTYDCVVANGYASPQHTFFRRLWDHNTLRNTVNDLADTLMEAFGSKHANLATPGLVWAIESP